MKKVVQKITKPPLAGGAKRRKEIRQSDEDDGCSIVQQLHNSSYFHNGSEVFMSVWSEYCEIFNPTCPFMDLNHYHCSPNSRADHTRIVVNQVNNPFSTRVCVCVCMC